MEALERTVRHGKRQNRRAIPKVTGPFHRGADQELPKGNFVEAQGMTRIFGGRLRASRSRRATFDRLPNPISGRPRGGEPVGIRFPDGSQDEQAERGK